MTTATYCPQCGNELSSKATLEGLCPRCLLSFAKVSYTEDNTVTAPAPDRAEKDDLIGQILDEKYRLDEELGRGGMGTVYRATHLGTGRPVAVKVIAPQFMANEMFVERFKREAKTAGRLRHPNVVNVTDFGFAPVESRRVAYLVMEYLNGCTLGEFIRKQERLPLGFVVDVVEQVCLAIGEAHKQGVIHRDLKPDNIWLEPNGRGGYNVKVLDFGLAKLRDTAQPNLADKAQGFSFADTDSASLSVMTAMQATEIETEAPTKIKVETVEKDKVRTVGEIDGRTVPEWLTRAGMVLGTPLYMSPEQCHGKELDTRSDIYSLGVVVYEMLTGETPFTGDTYQLIAKHTDMPPPPIRKKRSDITKSISDLIMSALSKNPEERPSTSAAFATAFRICAEGEKHLSIQAQDILRKNFFVFISISAIVSAPFLLVISLYHLFLDYVISESDPYFSVDLFFGYMPIKWLSIILFFWIILLTYTANIAAYTLAIEQLRILPTDQIQISSIIKHLAKRWGALATTTLWGFLTALLWPLRPILPQLKSFIDISLYPSVIIMEEKYGWAALNRSKALVDSLRPVAKSFWISGFSNALFAYLVLSIAWFSILKDIVNGNTSISVLSSPLMLFLLTAMLFMFVFFTIATSLLYFNSRQVKGETPDEIPPEEFKFTKISRARKLLYISAVITLVPASTIILFDRSFLDADRERERKGNLLYDLSCSGQTGRLRTLIRAGARWNDSSYSNKKVNPLICAAANGHTETVKVLLATDIYRDAFQSKDGITSFITLEEALICAVAGGHKETIKALLAGGAKMSYASPTQSLLSYPIQNGIFSYLLIFRDVQTVTALMVAVAKKDIEMVKLLIAAGAKVSEEDNYAFLRESLHTQNPEMISLLTSAGMKMNPGNNPAQLIKSVAENDIEMVKLFIAARANLNMKGKDGNTALIKAAIDGNIDIAKLLIDAGADLKAVNDQGHTALSVAIFKGDTKMVNVLDPCRCTVVRSPDGSSFTINHQ